MTRITQQLSDITKELPQSSLPVRLQHSGKLFIDLKRLLWNIQSRVQHHVQTAEEANKSATAASARMSAQRLSVRKGH